MILKYLWLQYQHLCTVLFKIQIHKTYKIVMLSTQFASNRKWCWICDMAAFHGVIIHLTSDRWIIFYSCHHGRSRITGVDTLDMDLPHMDAIFLPKLPSMNLKNAIYYYVTLHCIASGKRTHFPTKEASLSPSSRNAPISQCSTPSWIH